MILRRFGIALGEELLDRCDITLLESTRLKRLNPGIVDPRTDQRRSPLLRDALKGPPQFLNGNDCFQRMIALFQTNGTPARSLRSTECDIESGVWKSCHHLCAPIWAIDVSSPKIYSPSIARIDLRHTSGKLSFHRTNRRSILIKLY
jgi:hypothetical protein